MSAPRRTSRRRPASDCDIAVYLGRELIGEVIGTDGGFTAMTTDGSVRGSFTSSREATIAILESHRGRGP